MATTIVPAIGGAIIGLILVVISAFKPQYSPILAPDMPYSRVYLLVAFLPSLKQNIRE
jgi:uncharacterized YccA/Bax inhibitor family protein